MKTTSELVTRIMEFEQSGFTRSEAIELIKIERLMILNNEIKQLNENIKHKDI